MILCVSKHLRLGVSIYSLFKSAYKWAKRGFMCFLGKFSNWEFKCYILGGMLMHHKQCINFFPKKCKLGKIPICCQKMYSQELKCSPVSSSIRYLEILNSNFSQKSQQVSMKAYWQYLSGKALKTRLACQFQKI